MTELQHIRDWYHYNSDTRKGYLKTLSRLPRRTILKDRKASFPSLLSIYVHILDAYQFYFGHAYPGTTDQFQRRSATIKTIAQARSYERQVDRLVSAFLKRLTPRLLEKSFSFTRTTGRIAKMTVRDMLLHMAEEELQHKGELIALLWQIDVEPPYVGFQNWRQGRRGKMKRP